MKRKRFKIFIVLFVLMLLLSGCSNTKKYYVPAIIYELNHTTASENVDQIKRSEIFNGKYEDIYADADGNLVLVATDEQQKALLDLAMLDMEYYVFVFAQDECIVEYNDSFTEVSIQCKKEEFGEKISMDDLEVLTCQLLVYQAFLGIMPNENMAHGIIVDIDTGEILYEKSIPQLD